MSRLNATIAAVLLLALLAVQESAAADKPDSSIEITLTGNWSGRWADSRPGYAPNGGDFTGVAVENSAGEWSATFVVGKTLVFKAELKGKLVDGKIRFDTAVSLGKFHGVYTFKGWVTRDEFTGEYEGPDEKGTFKMTRAVEAQK